MIMNTIKMQTSFIITMCTGMLTLLRALHAVGRSDFTKLETSAPSLMAFVVFLHAAHGFAVFKVLPWITVCLFFFIVWIIGVVLPTLINLVLDFTLLLVETVLARNIPADTDKAPVTKKKKNNTSARVKATTLRRHSVRTIARIHRRPGSSRTTATCPDNSVTKKSAGKRSLDSNGEDSVTKREKPNTKKVLGKRKWDSYREGSFRKRAAYGKFDNAPWTPCRREFSRFWKEQLLSPYCGIRLDMVDEYLELLAANHWSETKSVPHNILEDILQFKTATIPFEDGNQEAWNKFFKTLPEESQYALSEARLAFVHVSQKVTETQIHASLLVIDRTRPGRELFICFDSDTRYQENPLKFIQNCLCDTPLVSSKTEWILAKASQQESLSCDCCAFTCGFAWAYANAVFTLNADALAKPVNEIKVHHTVDIIELGMGLRYDIHQALFPAPGIFDYAVRYMEVEFA